MINKTEIASKFVKKYLNKDGTSKHSIRKLANILHTKHPDLYKDSEDARWNIKKLIGSLGEPNRTNALLDKHKIEWKGVKLPKPEKNDYSKVILKEKRIGILSDIHLPYFDETALNIALEYLYKWKPEVILLNGDTLDMYHASNFETNPKNRDIDYELAMCRDFLRQLAEEFNCRIIYKMGNHCERYEKKILQRLPQYATLDWMTLDAALHWKESYKIEIIGNKRIIKAGHLNILHGHEFSKGFIAPVNVSRGFYLKAKANVIAGHHHRISEHVETDLNGKMIGAWSTGCLCELNPQYMPINSWQHGFATVEILDNAGNFRVDNKRIIKGQIV